METQLNFNTPGKGNEASNLKRKTSHSQTTSISKVRVVVRVRPFISQEISRKNGHPVSCVSILDSEEFKSRDDVTVHLKDQGSSRQECYKLDGFFGQQDNNVCDIFEDEVKPLIPGVFQGCNATVFAYGATGSGKTYTMQGSEEQPGLMQLAMANILSICHGTETSVKISYYEVYMDRCYDLLELKQKEIAVLDDKVGQIHLRGLSQVEVNSISEFQEVFSCAIQRRKVARTGLNDVSSRSHGVLVISICIRDGSGRFWSGKLNLIDLAGSEDNRKACNEGIHLQESSKINQSLFALSNVIYALNNNKPRIPYRESKLTRILQDSLGGTSRALMVACLNPGEYQESVHTVSLASRSRHVSNFVSSAPKRDTPKVDMEVKLRDWLESKGKTTSAQRIGLFGSPMARKTPKSICDLRKSNAGWSSVKHKIPGNKGCSSICERDPNVACRNLFDHARLVAPVVEDIDLSARRTLEENFEFSIEEPSSSLPELSPGYSKIKKLKQLESPSRKALSPINSNKLSSRDQVQFDPDPKTPKTPFLYNGTDDNCDRTGASLNKFQSISYSLKNTLVQEYVKFLNTATREELLDLKGIGHKMAEYITELRETSPLRSLKDLEKIGLSAKQVHNMFSKAAVGILG
ncbi:OLC1v1034840C1 [Oldenlandia corymbosa var. corymbosa]|uniref:Kinesin-like protein n=1 Tax=Oldenlandia corymbosa var. corymbosa TaxID=529605 RepID=A0AAV1CRM9_OLDCO|nr:OLC1v1034840C1 [Oldenlandia corymbosa var. corymbosa]